MLALGPAIYAAYMFVHYIVGDACNVFVDPLNERRRRPATVEHAQRLVDGAGPEQAQPRVDGEHVERVVRDRPGGDGLDHSAPAPADPPVEAVLDVARERVGRNAV